MKREFRDYLQDILDAMDGVAAFTRDLTYEAFAQDRKTVSAVIRSILDEEDAN